MYIGLVLSYYLVSQTLSLKWPPIIPTGDFPLYRVGVTIHSSFKHMNFIQIIFHLKNIIITIWFTLELELRLGGSSGNLFSLVGRKQSILTMELLKIYWQVTICLPLRKKLIIFMLIFDDPNSCSGGADGWDIKVESWREERHRRFLSYLAYSRTRLLES